MSPFKLLMTLDIMYLLEDELNFQLSVFEVFTPNNLARGYPSEYQKPIIIYNAYINYKCYVIIKNFNKPRVLTRGISMPENYWL